MIGPKFVSFHSNGIITLQSNSLLAESADDVRTYILRVIAFRKKRITQFGCDLRIENYAMVPCMDAMLGTLNRFEQKIQTRKVNLCLFGSMRVYV